VVAWTKPRPNIDEDSAPFWEGLRRRQFLLFRCSTCGAWYWPKAFCRFHANEAFFGNLAWTPASGRGTVFTFSVHRVAFHPGFKDDLPYAYALIKLDEGPMFGTRLVEVDPDEVYIGMPVEIVYDDHPEEGFTIPLMRPQATGEQASGNRR
jgi:uncharacterized protein